MESQNGQGKELLAVLASLSVATDVLLALYSPLFALLFIVGLAHASFYLAVIGYLYYQHKQEKDQPMINLLRVVSLGQRCQEIAADGVVECLKERADGRTLFFTAALPAAAGVLMALTHGNDYLFALANAFYVLALTLAFLAAAARGTICRGDVGRAVGLALAASFIIVVAANGYVRLTNHSVLEDVLSLLSLVSTFVAYLMTVAILMPADPNIFIKKTEVQDTRTAYRRFVEDLELPCDYEPPPLPCSCVDRPPLHQEYLKLRRIICSRDLEVAKQVEESWPLIIAAYHSATQSDLELARGLVEILRSRSLDEAERVAFQILEFVYETASNPPCGNPEALRQYLERLNNIDAPGWSRLLKILTQVYLGYADPDYVAAVKRGIMRSIDNCSGDNLSVYYYVLKALDRVKPLCREARRI